MRWHTVKMIKNQTVFLDKMKKKKKETRIVINFNLRWNDSSLKDDEFILFKFCDTTNNNFQKIFLNKHRIIINNTGYLIMFEIRIFFSRQFHLVSRLRRCCLCLSLNMLLGMILDIYQCSLDHQYSPKFQER